MENNVRDYAVYGLYEYEVSYLKEVAGEFFIHKVINGNQTTEKVEVDEKYESELEAIVDLSNKYYPDTFTNALISLMGYQLDWDSVDNARVYNNPLGKYDYQSNEYKNTAFFNEDATDDYELTVVEGLIATANAIRKLIK